jgi:hypothetical protein
MRGEVVPSRPDMSRSMAISAKIPSVMSVELIPAKTVHTGLRKFRNGAYLGSGPTFGSRFMWVRKKIAPERWVNNQGCICMVGDVRDGSKWSQQNPV